MIFSYICVDTQLSISDEFPWLIFWWRNKKSHLKILYSEQGISFSMNRVGKDRSEVNLIHAEYHTYREYFPEMLKKMV